MRNNIEIYRNEEFGEIRSTVIDGEPYFIAKDIAYALGYKDPKNTIKNRCKRGRVSEIPHPQNPNKSIEITVIPESDIYRLIMGSKLPSAQKFESWVTEEVLPTIQKHGVYMTNEIIEEILTSPDFLIQLATQLKEEKEARILAEETLKEQKPLVDFAAHVSDSTNLISMGKMAKLLKNEHINIGRNRLFDWLRKKGILMLDNTPYQRFIDNGYFRVKESVYESSFGPRTQQTTYVTGKGQIYITRQLKEEYCR